MEDRRSDNGTRDRLEDIQVGYEKWGHKTYRILVCVILVFAITVLLMVYLVRENRIRATETDQQREAILYQLCQEQNFRNMNTIRVLDDRIALAKKHANKERLAQLQASREFTVLLIDALAPKANCNDRVDLLTDLN